MLEPPVTLPRFCGPGYVARLRRRGYEVIRHGGNHDPVLASTLVLAKPGADHVLKVGIADTDCDPWPTYAAWCFRHPGPFRPSIRALRWHGTGMNRFYVASMERLYTPLSVYTGLETEKLTADNLMRLRMNAPLAWSVIDATAGWYRMLENRGIDYWRVRVSAVLCSQLSGRLVKKFRRAGLRDIASFLDLLACSFTGCVFDPRPPNWMFTWDGRLVFIDPFSRSSRCVPETAPRLSRQAALRLI